MLAGDWGGVVSGETRRMFKFLDCSLRRDYSPDKLCQAFVPPIDPRIQQDTSEYFNSLFDLLSSELKDTPAAGIVNEVFGGETVTQMICGGCHCVREIVEPFNYYGVGIKGQTELCGALEAGQHGETISDYYCEDCKQRHDTLRRTLLKRLPNYLLIALQRIVFDMDFFANRKLHSRLEFSSSLDLEPFTHEGVQLREKGQRQAASEQDRRHGHAEEHYSYTLHSVIVHQGRAEQGHYTYFRRKSQDSWLKFDDLRVTVESGLAFEQECFGDGPTTDADLGEFGETSRNAYVLIYERKRKAFGSFVAGASPQPLLMAE